MTADKPFLTVDDVLDCHAQFGRLDFDAVKKGMGPNWPPHWDKFKNGGAIFEGRRRRKRAVSRDGQPRNNNVP